MAGIYLDTSALGRVLLAEPDATAIRGVLDQHDDWWSSEFDAAIGSVLTYDRQLQAGCRHHGLDIAAPSQAG
jgi:hypothetical protein